jgi:hypothetical protein
VELGCVLLHETNEANGKSKVVPDYKLEHTNKELDGRLTYPGSVLLQRTHACFVAS